MSASRGGAEPPVPVAVLAAAFLFNLGQGVLRPSMPLYLQRTFSANYRMVTLIPVVFGAGKWAVSLPTGYLLDRLGRPLMIWGLVVIAAIDVASILTPTYGVFLGLRALGGAGWAMFATVATTTMVNLPGAERRGRTVSLLLMSETSGLLVGSAASGWLYQRISAASPFVFEAACMLVAAVVVARWASLPGLCPPEPREAPERRLLRPILRTPGVLLMGVTNATLIAIQTGVLVFLFPLYLVNRGNVEPQTVGLLVSLSVLGRLLALWVGGGVSDRWGRLPVLIRGLAVYAVLLGGVPFLLHPVALGVVSVGIGAAAGFVAALPTAIIGDQVPAEWRGVAIGWLRTMTDGGQIVGPLGMGAIADAVDLSTPFLLGALLLVATAWRCHRRAGAMAPAQVPAGGRRVLVVTAHPDDPEFAAGGTIAKLARQGCEVTYVIATNGNKGSGDRAISSEGLMRVRQEEQQNAARVLGVARVQFLGYEDGEVEDTRPLRRDVTREIRRWRPELIITSHPGRSYSNFFAWHRDHRIIAGVVLDCVYPLARDHLSFPELLPEHEPHKVREVYLVQWEHPQLTVDVTETMELKLQAARCHASQVADFTDFEARLRKRAAEIGAAHGYRYAEGFDRVVLPG